MKLFFSILVSLALLVPILPSQAAVVSANMDSSSMYFGEPSTYTLKFLAPKGLQIGYIGVSFANSYVDLSKASLSVSGISGGRAIVDYDPGISGNHDLQYKMSSVVTLDNDTWITLTVTGAVNPPGPNGSVGWDYIEVSDSITAHHDAFWTYNQANDTNLRVPSNIYLRLKDKAAVATPAPTAPTASATTTAAPAPAVSPASTAPALPPIQININQSLTITNITIANFFYFEGSQTTDLKSIEDPSRVEDFTLDTEFGWEAVFEEDLDLTDKKKLTALDNVDQYWRIDFWFLYIRWEWFEIFDSPIEFTYENEDLTGCEPQINVSENKKSDPVKISESKPGSIKLKLDSGAKVEILPSVSIEGDKEIKTSANSHVFNGKTSHKNLRYFLKVNGQEKEVSLKDFNDQSGEFKIESGNLTKGANFIQFYYQGDKDAEKKLITEKTVYVEESKVNELLPVYVISGLALFVALILLVLRFSRKT